MITTRKRAIYGIILLLFLILPIVSAYSNRPEICTPNSVWCGEGDKIMKCAEDGGEYLTLNECKSGEICITEKSEPKCVPANQETNIYLYLFGGLILIFLLIILIILIRNKKK